MKKKMMPPALLESLMMVPASMPTEVAVNDMIRMMR